MCMQLSTTTFPQEAWLRIVFFSIQKAKGDIKKKGKPDPYAYVPLMRQKLNKRKEAKLRGQFSGLLQKAKKGSAAGTKQRRKTFK